MKGRLAPRELLDAVANVLTVLLCVAAAVVLLPRACRGSASPSDIPLGSVFGSPAGIDLASADYTVLIAISSRCSYCAESMPSFRALSQYLASQAPPRGQLAVVSAEDPLLLAQYLERNGMAAVRSFRMPRDLPLVSKTPRVVVLDRNGVVRGTWLGRFDPAKQKEVIRLVS